MDATLRVIYKPRAGTQSRVNAPWETHKVELTCIASVTYTGKRYRQQHSFIYVCSFIKQVDQLDISLRSD